MSQDCNCHGASGKHSQVVTGLLERPLYAPGLVLQDLDLTAAVDYTRSLNRMLFKHLFGCGVVCGLEVTAREHCGLRIDVSPGLALDGCGDPVHLARSLSFAIDERETDALRKANKPVWVVLCGKEKLCAPRALVCDSDDFDAVTLMTRARAQAEVSLVFKEPECICKAEKPATEHSRKLPDGTEMKCVDPYPFDCADDCGCGSACGCGCCVLLGEVKWDGEDPVVGQVGVRRVVRPRLVEDVERCPKQVDTLKPTEAPTPTEVPKPPEPPKAAEPVPPRIEDPPPPPPVKDKEPRLTTKQKESLARIVNEAETHALGMIELEGWDKNRADEFVANTRREAIEKIIASQ